MAPVCWLDARKCAQFTQHKCPIKKKKNHSLGLGAFDKIRNSLYEQES